ncbi:MAG: DNA-binding protein WhiA [Clostridia bacterium]|nr:DNA-binding protein WhiA [Clostridia bacterium]
MSFSSTVKKELTSYEVLSSCCSHAQAYGLVLFAHFSSFDISITTESEDISSLYVSTLSSVCGVTPVCESQNEQKKYSYFVKTAAQRIKVLNEFGHSEKEITLRINRANIQDECCRSAFLRGVFIACGTVTDPKKNYHLEFVVSHKKLCGDLMTFMRECGFNPKFVLRKGYYIVYFKESESIEDILTFMGATESSLALMGIKMEKDVKNRVNRKVNFEISNLNKTIEAGSRQAEDIRLIENTKGLSSLPDNLREIAKLRLENPDISLTELGTMLSVPLSRSGLNHRLAKLSEIARQIKENN